jgi:transcriptional regulator with XRE-family HTH domain
MKMQEAREAKGLGRLEIAQIANSSQTFISLIESGKTFPSVQFQRRVESFLGKIDWIATGFTDRYYFTRVFSKTMEASPGEYKKNSIFGN